MSVFIEVRHNDESILIREFQNRTSALSWVQNLYHTLGFEPKFKDEMWDVIKAADEHYVGTEHQHGSFDICIEGTFKPRESLVWVVMTRDAMTHHVIDVEIMSARPSQSLLHTVSRKHYIDTFEGYINGGDSKRVYPFGRGKDVNRGRA